MSAKYTAQPSQTKSCSSSRVTALRLERPLHNRSFREQAEVKKALEGGAEALLNKPIDFLALVTKSTAASTGCAGIQQADIAGLR